MCFKKKEYPIPQPLWENGTKCADGDSNVHNCNVKQFYGKEWFSVGVGGSTTNDVILRIPAVIKRFREKPFSMYVCQVGGNNWVLGDCSVEKYWADMEFIMKAYLEILPPKKLGFCSLPYVNPNLSYGDRFGKRFDRINLNNVFKTASFGLADLCNKYGTKFINIMLPLETLYKQDPNNWYDVVHYKDKGRIAVGNMINSTMGI